MEKLTLYMDISDIHFIKATFLGTTFSHVPATREIQKLERELLKSNHRQRNRHDSPSQKRNTFQANLEDMEY